MFSKKIVTVLLASSILMGASFTAAAVAPVSPFSQEVQAASAINDYITQNNIQPVSIQYQEGTFNQWFGYENGVGKPEGVVVHETATPGVTATQYAASFNNNWKTNQAYVHAFIDDTTIINIHDTDYGVWGAGPKANNKYIQVELCEVATQDQFARSVANDAFYVATMLHKYGLPVQYGNTVVSHNQVSQWWHETTHTDPTGYFAKWGYSMEQFVELVQKYADQLNGDATNNSVNNGGLTLNLGTVLANNPNSYATPLVMFQADGSTKPDTRGLANNTPWYADQQRSYQGHTYYRVSTNEWVMDTYAQFTAKK